MVGIAWPETHFRARGHHNGEGAGTAPIKIRSKLQTALQQQAGIGPQVLQVIEITGESTETAAQQFMTLLSRGITNEARVEMPHFGQPST